MGRRDLRIEADGTPIVVVCLCDMAKLGLRDPQEVVNRGAARVDAVATFELDQRLIEVAGSNQAYSFV